MLKIIRQLYSELTGKTFSALKSDANQKHLSDDKITRIIELPPHIIPLRDANDLPKDYQVISQAPGVQRKDKTKSLVLIDREHQSDVCVLKSADVAFCLISTSLYGTAAGKSLTLKIRNQLSTQNLSIRFEWCIPALLKEVTQASYLQAQRDDSEELRKKYDTEPNRIHFKEILMAALKVGASDVHIELKEDIGLVRFTIDTELWPWDNGRGGVIMKNLAEALMGFAFYFSVDKGSNSTSMYSYFESLNWTITENDLEGYASVKLRMQSNAKLAEQGPDLIYRILPIGKSTKNYKLSEMGYAPDHLHEIREALLTAGGLFLMAGIPNSGKTTAIKAAIEEVPDRERKKFVIAEDPAEYVLDFASHATIQAGLNDADRPEKYAAMIGGWLRGNPHILATGEIRDLASAVATMAATGVGCMAFATIHANSIIGIFDRLTENLIGLDIKTITSEGKFKLLAYQKLLPVLCKECRISISDMDLNTQTAMRQLGKKFGVDVSKVNYRHIAKPDDESKCECCDGRGVKGMTLAAEVYAPTELFLHHMRNQDVYNARKEWQRLSDGRLDTPYMNGKQILHHGFYKMLQGELDISSVRQLGRFDSLLEGRTEGRTEEIKSDLIKVGT